MISGSKGFYRINVFYSLLKTHKTNNTQTTQNKTHSDLLFIYERESRERQNIWYCSRCVIQFPLGNSYERMSFYILLRPAKKNHWRGCTCSSAKCSLALHGKYRTQNSKISKWFSFSIMRQILYSSRKVVFKSGRDINVNCTKLPFWNTRV